jgi:hypothetical protein
MASKYCLIKPLADKFKQALKSGKINPEELAGMSSAKRREFLEGIIGKDAKDINALFEKKMLQKNKWNAYLNWAKEVTGIKPEIKRDLISRIEKMAADDKVNILNPAEEKAFLNDLVDSKLGMNVTMEESKNISKLATKLTEAKNKWKGGDSLDVGASQVALERYIENIKFPEKGFIKEGKKFISMWNHPLQMIEYLAGNAKAAKSSFDNSFALRQGLKTLWTHPVTWSKNFAKSWVDLARGLKGDKNAVMDAIKTEIYSRENYINGNFKKMKLDLGGVEEAYPETLGESIPLFKNLFVASEVAYNGMGMRLRADLADTLLKSAEKQGIDIGEKIGKEGKTTQGEAIGKLINSMTGRGHLGELEKIGKHLNVLLFSPKYLKSQIDTVGQILTGAGGSNFVRLEAAKNLFKIAAGTAFVLATADRLYPGSVDWDTRSSNFGKIKIGNTRFDVTGGLASLITLTSRLAPTMHNGQWGMWSKSASTNNFTRIGKGFGVKNGTDLLVDFGMGKLSPSAGLVRDLLRQKDMKGNPFNTKDELLNLFTPLPTTDAYEAFKDPNSAPLWLTIIAGGLGVSPNTYSSATNWNINTGKELNQFKDKVGQDKFNEANKEYNQIVAQKTAKMITDDRYKKLSDEDKQKAITMLRSNTKADIYKKYKFTYKQDRAKKSENKEIKNIIK